MTPTAAVEALEAVADTGRQALGDMRSLVDALRPRDPAAPGAAAHDDDVPALARRGCARPAWTSRSSSTGRPVPLDRAIALAAYRVVQEALTNVVKHAGPEASAAGRADLDRTTRCGSRSSTTAVRDVEASSPAAGGHGLRRDARAGRARRGHSRRRTA